MEERARSSQKRRAALKRRRAKKRLRKMASRMILELLLVVFAIIVLVVGLRIRRARLNRERVQAATEVSMEASDPSNVSSEPSYMGRLLNLEVLQKLISDAEAVTPEAGKEDAYEAVQKALDAAREVYDQGAPNDEEFVEVYAALIQSLENLNAE